MNQSLLIFPLFFCSLLFLLFLSLVIYCSIDRRGSSSKTKNLPPGPWKLPIIGNLHQLIMGGSPLVHRTFESLAKKHGPLMHLQIGQLSTIVISSKEVAEDAFKTYDLTFCQRSQVFAEEVITIYKGLGISFAPYGDYWRQLRKICSLHLLSSKKVNSFGSIREEEVKGFIESISNSYASSASGPAINLSKMIYKLNHQVISRAAFGDKDNNQEAFINRLKEQMELGGKVYIPTIFPSLKFVSHLLGVKQTLDKMQLQLDAIIEEILKSHRAETARKNTSGGPADDGDDDDIVDVLLKLQASGDQVGFHITDMTIKAVIVDLFVGAGDNPSAIVEWAMAEMLVNPNVMKKAQAEVREAVSKRGGKIEEIDIKELTYLNAIIKESLRLHPAIPMIPRECRESCKINGYKIPSNTNIVINLWAIGRDPKYWVDPESFRPERFLDNLSMDVYGSKGEFTPFGAGRRICPGISFAMASMELPLVHLLYHFDWKLPYGVKPKDVDMTEMSGVSSGKKVELVAIPVPYNPPN